MPTLVKSYYITHIDKMIIEASSFRRPFDDLYEELNGLLNSDNLSSNFGMLSSQVVTVTSTFYSGTSISAQLHEVLPKGYTDIHFFAYGVPSSSKRLCIFPGRAEINSTIVKVKQRIDLDISNIAFLSNSFTLFENTSGAYSANNHVGVFFNKTNIITASDIFLYQVTATTLAGNARFGVYNSTASDSRRGFFVFSILKNVNIVEEYEYLTPPMLGQRYRLANSEALSMYPFFDIYTSASFLVNGSSAFGVTSVIRYLNMSTWNYEYEVGGFWSSQCGIRMCIANWTSVAFGSSSFDHWVYKGKSLRLPGNSWFVASDYFATYRGGSATEQASQEFTKAAWMFVSNISQTNNAEYTAYIYKNNIQGLITNG